MIITDCFGPLPKSRSGNGNLLTILCASTCFPIFAKHGVVDMLVCNNASYYCSSEMIDVV